MGRLRQGQAVFPASSELLPAHALPLAHSLPLFSGYFMLRGPTNFPLLFPPGKATAANQGLRQAGIPPPPFFPPSTSPFLSSTISSCRPLSSFAFTMAGAGQLPPGLGLPLAQQRLQTQPLLPAPKSPGLSLPVAGRLHTGNTFPTRSHPHLKVFVDLSRSHLPCPSATMRHQPSMLP